MDITAWEWGVMLPEFIVLGTATLLSLIDLFLPKGTDRRIFGWLGLLGVIIAGMFVLQRVGSEPVSIMNDMFRSDAFATAFKLIFLAGVALVFLMSLDRDEKREVVNRGEYYYLLLTALLGAMFMASSADLITLFVGLELLSLSSYILVGIRKRNLASNESAFKYVINGGIATALTLYGMSFVYGLTGSTDLFLIGERLNEAIGLGLDSVVFLGIILMFIGLSFKISVVPFHMWTPDVYQGAPTPITAFLSVISKAAGFAIIIRIFMTAFVRLIDNETGEYLYTEIALFVGVAAALSMIIGNTLALRQTNIKRMMAYSTIAQAGYILVPFVTLTELFFSQTLYYIFAYLLMNLGAFAVIHAVNRDRGTEDIKGFAGLYHRSPFMGIAMTFFLLSLAGIPVTAGFFGKFYIFMSSLAINNYWLASIMVATSVVSYFYYFGVMRQMYMRPGTTESKVKVPAAITLVIVACFIGTVGLGILPDTVLNYLHENFNFFDEVLLK